MSIANQVPESSMEEILASIRKIISEDESKAIEPTVAPVPSQPQTSRPSDNVSPLFADRQEAARQEGERAVASPLPLTKAAPSEVRSERPAYVRSAEAGEVRARPEDSPSRPRPSEPSHRLRIDRQLLSSDAESAVSASFGELKSATARTVPHPVDQLAAELMRPMLKAWLDENLPPLVERLVRDEIERLSRGR
jgi:uncharacterized protein